jgi:NADPH-dependent curcumin reductase CurA
MATTKVANVAIKELDRMKALAKHLVGVVIEGRSCDYSIAFTYSPGAGWYTVEIQDGNEIRRLEPDRDITGTDLGLCAEKCGRPARVKYSGQDRAVCMECYMAINAERSRERYGTD